MKKGNHRLLIIIVLIASTLLICVLVPVLYILFYGGIGAVSIASPSHVPPVLTGGLIFQRVSTVDNGQSYTSLGFFELQGGMSEPIPAIGLGFDPSVITGVILAVSPDQRYLVFSPNYLFDTKTGDVTSLFSTTNNVFTTMLVSGNAMFSPDSHYLAYTLWQGKFLPSILTVVDLATRQSSQIYQTDCATYDTLTNGTQGRTT